MKKKAKGLLTLAGILGVAIITIVILILVPVRIVPLTSETELKKKNSEYHIEITPKFNKNNTEIISISDLFSVKLGKISKITRKSDGNEINISNQTIKLDPRFQYSVEINPYFGRSFSYDLVFNYENSILLKHSNNPTNILKIIPKDFVGRNLNELYDNYPEIKNQFIYENKELTKPILNNLHNIKEIFIANYESQEVLSYEIVYKFDDKFGKDISDYELKFRNHINSKGVKGQVIPFDVPLIQGYETPNDKTFILDKNNQKHYVIYKENNNLGNKVKVLFKVNNEIVKRLIVDKNTTITPPTDIIFPKGYNFIRWDLNDTKFNFNTKITQNTTLEAKLEKDLTMFSKVTFIYGELNNKIIEVLKGEKVQKPLEDPKLNNHIFVEWQLNNQKFDFENTIIEKDITLQPKFIEDKESLNKLTYKINYYSKDLNDDTYTLIETLSLTGNKNEKVNADIKNFRGFIFEINNPNNKLSSTLTDNNLVLNVYYERKAFNVIFDLNGGISDVEFNNQNIIFQGNVKKPSKNPVKEGYIFIRWELNHLEYKFTEEVTENIRLSAIYEKINPNKLKYVTEYYVERVEDNNYEIIKSENNIGIINQSVNAIIKDFTGFTYDEANSLNKLSGIINNKDQLILKVYYNRNRYNVTFNLDGGNWNLDTTLYQNLKFGSLVKNPNQNPTKEDSLGFKYTFSHWELNGERYNFGLSINNNINLTAKYTTNELFYDVTFDLNGGKVNSEITTQKVKYNGSVQNPNLTPIKEKTELERYTFKYWTLDNQEFNFETYKVTKNIQLVAYYEVNTKASYKIEYYQENLNDDNYALFETKILETTANTSISIDNKVFEGFKFNSNHLSNITNGIATNDDKLVLKAYYDRNRYNITFNLDGGSSTMEKEFTVKHGALIKEPVDKPIKQGYIFSHYEVENETFLFTTQIIKHTTLIAIYHAKDDTRYTIEHYLENIDNNQYSKTSKIKYGKTNTIATAEIDTVVGFNFDDSNPLNIKNGTITADGELVLKLYYTRNRYSISFNLNGGHGSIDDIQNVKHGALISMPNIEIIKEQSDSTIYKFKEWQLDDRKFDFNATPITSTITLKAFYEETIRKYTISYNLSGGHSTGNTQAIELEYNQLVPVPTFEVLKDENETHQFKFSFWSYKNQRFNFSSHRVTSNIELKAEFTEEPISVTINFITEEGVEILGRKTYFIGETIENTASKKYYDFQGFSLEPNGEVEFDIYAEKNLTLYPIFVGQSIGKIRVNIKYEKLQNSILPQDHQFLIENKEIGSTYYYPVQNITGFYFNQDISISEVVVQPEIENEIVIFYSRNVYTVTFDSYGTKVPTPSVQHVKYGATVTDPKSSINSSIGKLYGWSINPGKSDPTNIYNFSSPVTNNLILYVNYEHNFSGDMPNYFPQSEVKEPFINNVLKSKTPFRIRKTEEAANNSIIQDEMNYLFHENNVYEKFNGKFYKYEIVEWTKSTKTNVYFTKKIIDFTLAREYTRRNRKTYSDLYFNNFINPRLGTKDFDYTLIYASSHNGEAFEITDYASARQNHQGNRLYEYNPNNAGNLILTSFIIDQGRAIYLSYSGESRVLPPGFIGGIVLTKGFYTLPENHYPKTKVTSHSILEKLQSASQHLLKFEPSYPYFYGYEKYSYQITKLDGSYYVKYNDFFYRYENIEWVEKNGRVFTKDMIDVGVFIVSNVFSSKNNLIGLKEYLSDFESSNSQSVKTFGIHFFLSSDKKISIPSTVLPKLDTGDFKPTDFAKARMYQGIHTNGITVNPVSNDINTYFIRENSNIMDSKQNSLVNNTFYGIILEKVNK